MQQSLIVFVVSLGIVGVKISLKKVSTEERSAII